MVKLDGLSNSTIALIARNAQVEALRVALGRLETDRDSIQSVIDKDTAEKGKPHPYSLTQFQVVARQITLLTAEISRLQTLEETG